MLPATTTPSPRARYERDGLSVGPVETQCLRLGDRCAICLYSITGDCYIAIAHRKDVQFLRLDHNHGNTSIHRIDINNRLKAIGFIVVFGDFHQQRQNFL